MRPIRVLVVDDSAFMRHALGRLIDEAEGMETVGAVGDGEQGLAAAAELRPDVITLDVEMPVLDGLGMLRRLMRETPSRVVMLSSLTTRGAAVTLDALEAGAVDFVAKPSGSLSINLGAVREELSAKIRAAAAISEAAFLRYRPALLERRVAVDPGLRVTAPPPARGHAADRPRTPADRVVVVAVSTGGPRALQALVAGLPDRLAAGVIVVQHMPAGFTASLAERLDAAGPLPVREASGGDLVARDEIVVAPGGHHLIASGGGRLQLTTLPPVNGVRPAADVTLQSAATVWRDRTLAVVLTGMGSDGREGARAVRRHGGTVFAQDEATATVFGMPAAVIEAGLAEQVLPLERIPEAIARWAHAGGAAGQPAGRRLRLAQSAPRPSSVSSVLPACHSIGADPRSR